MANFCQTCGAPIASNDVYCVRCGAPITGTAANSNPFATPSYSRENVYFEYDDRDAPDIPSNPIAAFKICVLQKYANFSDRASRSEYWLQILTTYVLLFGAMFSALAIATATGCSEEATTGVAVWAALAVALPLAIPNIAVTARRLHDRNMTGWWQLTPKIPYVGFIFGIYLFVQYVQAGKPEPNKYGPAPRRR